MRSRLIVSTAAASLLLLGLAACTTPPTPKPLTVEQKCTPKTATIQWEPSDELLDPSNANYVNVRATLLDYSQGDGLFTVRSADFAPPVKVVYTDADAMRFRTDTPDAVWGEALITSVRLTGQVPTDFGVTTKLPPDTTTVNTKRGKYLDVDQENLASIPFSIRCAGEKPIDGQVIGVISGATRGTLMECGQKMQKNPPESEKETYAVLARYCKSLAR
jgi:hypothetical protein